MYIIGAWHAHANAFYGHEPNIMYGIWLVSVWRLAPQFPFFATAKRPERTEAAKEQTHIAETNKKSVQPQYIEVAYCVA